MRRVTLPIAFAFCLAFVVCSKESASSVAPVLRRTDAPERTWGTLHHRHHESALRLRPPAAPQEPVQPSVVWHGWKHWPEPVDWDSVASCESGGRWDYNGPSGFDGGLQFLPSTWISNGGEDFAPYAWGASKAEQIIVAERLYKARGDLGAWPWCGRFG